jgi:hypothetical protein
MKEKDFQREFHKWCKYNWFITSAFELKLCKSNSLNFKAVAPHQEENLFKTCTEGLFYKIPDDSIGQKPFDCFKIKGYGFIVVMYYKPGNKEFFIIDINNWLAEKSRSNRCSLTEEKAREIAWMIGKLGVVYK